MASTIKITCNGNRTLPLADLLDFQGNLKFLADAEFQKLRRLILKRGFSYPVFVWGGNNIMDGHQRLLVLRHLIEKEGYVLGGGYTCLRH